MIPLNSRISYLIENAPQEMKDDSILPPGFILDFMRRSLEEGTMPAAAKKEKPQKPESDDPRVREMDAAAKQAEPVFKAIMKSETSTAFDLIKFHQEWLPACGSKRLSRLYRDFTVPD